MVTRLNETKKVIEFRESQLGIGSPKIPTSLEEQLALQNQRLANAREQLERLENARNDCQEHQRIPKIISEIDSLLSQLPLEITETQRNLSDTALYVHSSCGDCERFIESFNDRLGTIQIGVEKISRENHWLELEILSVNQSIEYSTQRLARLKGQVIPRKKRVPTLREVRKMNEEVTRLERDIFRQSVKNKTLLSISVLTYFIETILYRLFNELSLVSIVVELVPSVLLPEAYRKFLDWRTQLENMQGVDAKLVPVEPLQILLSLKKDQLNVMRENRREARLNDWRSHLINLELGLIRTSIRQEERKLEELDTRRYTLKSFRLQKEMERYEHAQSLAKLRHAAHVLRIRTELVKQLAAKQQSLTRLEAEKKTLKSRIPDVRRNCRSYNERAFQKAKIELESMQTQIVKVEANIRKEIFMTERVEEFFESVRTLDPVLSRLRTERDKLENEINNLIDFEIRNITATQTELLGDLKKTIEEMEFLYHRNDSLSKRFAELSLETPKLEAELAVKDEVIYNTTLRQSEARIILSELEPRRVDKEVNLSIWTDRLNLIDEEIMIIKHRISLNNCSGNIETLSEEFRNISHILFETYKNLTTAEEGLVNSTKKTTELVEEFQKSEQNYKEKERELEEYTKLVNAGIIPKVNFKFEY